MVKKEDLLFLETGCKTIDDLLGGGIPYGIVTSIFGEPLSGKSIFGSQIALANTKKTNKNTILIETEGLRNYDVKLILYKLMNRWELTKEQVDEKFKIYHTMGDRQLQSIQVLFKMFGVLPMIEKSDKGKFTVNFNEKLKPTISEDDLKNTSMIILDSYTNPIKDAIGANTPNLPARAALTQKLFNLLYNIAMNYNIAIIVIHHASIDPQAYGRDWGKIYGGDPVLYNSKYAIEFIGDAPNEIKKTTGWGIEARRVLLCRRPCEPNTKELYPIRLKKDYGYTNESD